MTEIGKEFLSIPLWSDFIGHHEGRKERKEVPFNPTMV